MKLVHLHLKARNLESTVEFYKNILNFDIVVSDGETVYLRDEFGFDLVFSRSNSTLGSVLGDDFHFGYRCHDSESVRKQLDRVKNMGLEVHSLNLDGSRYVSFRIKDPDGYCIEIYWDNF